jgi:Tol biopolymer transport system component
MIGGRRARVQRARAASIVAPFAVLAALAGLTAAPAAATIAYERGSASATPSIWVAEDTGASPRQIVVAGGGFEPRIAPDASAVAFASMPVHGNPALELVPVAGGSITTLAKNEANMTNTAWSPDAKSIVTALGQSGGRETLVLITLATKASRVIATGSFQGVSFSPDSTQLAYARAANDRVFPTSSDIYTTPVAGGASARITSNHRSTAPVWGPTKIAFARTFKAPGRREDAPKSNVWLMNPDGSQARQLTRQKAPYLLSGPAPLQWSASGAQLLAQFGGQDTIYGEAVNPSTGAVRTLTAKKSVALQLIAAGISRDGSTVLGATGGFEPGPGHNVVTVPFAGGPVKVLIRNAFAPSWNG